MIGRKALLTWMQLVILSSGSIFAMKMLFHWASFAWKIYNHYLLAICPFLTVSLLWKHCHHYEYLPGIVPDALGNLYRLSSLSIYNSTIVNMTERLGMLTNLYSLSLQDCSLTSLPELHSISELSSVNLHSNQLSKVDGLTSVYNLNIENNLFTDIPTLSTPSSLRYLYMNNNPVRNMLKITSYTDLQRLYLRNATLSSVPPTIDRLKKLQTLDLSYNKLFYLPNNILSLTNLTQLYIQNNLFTSTDIQEFKTRFNSSNPRMTLTS